jgi:hypothetical protein
MISEYLSNWQDLFVLGYFKEVIAETMTDSPHPQSFSKQINRGVKEAHLLSPWTRHAVHLRELLLVMFLNGLPIVSPGPAMSDPSTPCRRATPETKNQIWSDRDHHPVVVCCWNG